MRTCRQLMMIGLASAVLAVGAVACDSTDDVEHSSSGVPADYNTVSTTPHQQLVAFVLDLSIDEAGTTIGALCNQLDQIGQAEAYRRFSEGAAGVDEADLGVTKREVFNELVERCS